MSMRSRIRVVILLTLLAIMVSSAPTTALSETSRYFPETGYYVSGIFLEKFNSVPDPLKIFGYPITDEFTAPGSSPVAGLRVQYFQKTRFEYHPNELPGNQVQIANLGSDIFSLEDPGLPLLVLPKNHPECRYYAETGNQICMAFLNFYDKHGGRIQFGLPVSNIVTVNSRLVQYFEKARFEWREELPIGQRVVLTNLGQIYFGLYEDPSLKRQSAESALIPNTILELKVSAFPLHAVMPASGKQTIFILVQDQQSRPVQGAQITLTLRYADGSETKLTLIGANADGIASVTLTVEDKPLGLVEVIVSANLNSQVKHQTRTSFRIWW